MTKLLTIGGVFLIAALLFSMLAYVSTIIAFIILFIAAAVFFVRRNDGLSWDRAVYKARLFLYKHL